MYVALIDKDKKSRTVIDTKYDIGDIVTLKSDAGHLRTSWYRPSICDEFENGSKVCFENHWPVEVPIRYVVTDISVSAASSVLTYGLCYGDNRLAFPSGGCCVGIYEIEGKVDSCDYETDPVVEKWKEEIKNNLSAMSKEKEVMSKEKEVKEDPMYYSISDPNPENKGTGNRTLRKADWRFKQKDWVIMWGSGDAVRKPYILDRDWVVNHAFNAKSSNDRTEFMLIREKDIEKYIREHYMSKPLF